MSQKQTHTLKRDTSSLQYPIEICYLKPTRGHKDKLHNETNMKNDNIRALAFGQYILFLYYKQPISIYLGKRSNVEKPAEDPPWWP